MRLFSEEQIPNLLPYDGVAAYRGKVLTEGQSDLYFGRLLDTIDWRNDETVIFGRRIVTKRKVGWYGEKDFSYIYSGAEKRALRWTDELRSLRQIAEEAAGAKFNSCLLNLYHNGDEGVGWHSDNEESLVKNGTIASFSLGAERRFFFKHKKTKEAISIILENGSLLIMEGETQTNWLHSLPKSKRITTPRINLTFRVMREQAVSKVERDSYEKRAAPQTDSHHLEGF